MKMLHTFRLEGGSGEGGSDGDLAPRMGRTLNTLESTSGSGGGMQGIAGIQGIGGIEMSLNTFAPMVEEKGVEEKAVVGEVEQVVVEEEEEWEEDWKDGWDEKEEKKTKRKRGGGKKTRIFGQVVKVWTKIEDDRLRAGVEALGKRYVLKILPWYLATVMDSNARFFRSLTIAVGVKSSRITSLIVPNPQRLTAGLT